MAKKMKNAGSACVSFATMEAWMASHLWPSTINSVIANVAARTKTISSGNAGSPKTWGRRMSP